jgi:AbrB family looped-hinge helix DNA binding protein
MEVGNMLSTVTTKGQVTIPKAIRDIMNIQTNDRVSFTREGDRIVLQPVKTLKSFRGAVKAAGPAGSFSEERARAKAAVAERVRGESE